MCYSMMCKYQVKDGENQGECGRTNPPYDGKCQDDFDPDAEERASRLERGE